MFRNRGEKLVTVYNSETKDKRVFRLESFREPRELGKAKTDLLRQVDRIIEL
jgi:hypothetical protein